MVMVCNGDGGGDDGDKHGHGDIGASGNDDDDGWMEDDDDDDDECCAMQCSAVQWIRRALLLHRLGSHGSHESPLRVSELDRVQHPDPADPPQHSRLHRRPRACAEHTNALPPPLPVPVPMGLGGDEAEDADADEPDAGCVCAGDARERDRAWQQTLPQLPLSLLEPLAMPAEVVASPAARASASSSSSPSSRMRRPAGAPLNTPPPPPPPPPPPVLGAPTPSLCTGTGMSEMGMGTSRGDRASTVRREILAAGPPMQPGHEHRWAEGEGADEEGLDEDWDEGRVDEAPLPVPVPVDMVVAAAPEIVAPAVAVPDDADEDVRAQRMVGCWAWAATGMGMTPWGRGGRAAGGPAERPRPSREGPCPWPTLPDNAPLPGGAPTPLIPMPMPMPVPMVVGTAVGMRNAPGDPTLRGMPTPWPRPTLPGAVDASPDAGMPVAPPPSTPVPVPLVDKEYGAGDGEEACCCPPSTSGAGTGHGLAGSGGLGLCVAIMLSMAAAWAPFVCIVARRAQTFMGRPLPGPPRRANEPTDGRLGAPDGTAIDPLLPPADGASPPDDRLRLPVAYPAPEAPIKPSLPYLLPLRTMPVPVPVEVTLPGSLATVTAV